MPSIRATNINQTSARGVIEGLFFTADYYNLFEIELWDYSLTTYYYTVSWIDSSSVNKYSYYDISGLSAGTGYGFKGFVRNASGRTHVGNTSFYTESPPNPRPSNWAWSTLVSNAYVYSLNWILRANLVNAAEWNSFCARINEFRSYKNLSTYNFTSAIPGESVTLAMVNEAISAISPMTSVLGGFGPYSTLVNLSNDLNAIQ
ncbi:MAG: hypothetical protein K0S25_53 [Bacillus sp. (in: firmicutes)]|jgi:hypothetical protein|nr:hypothetical protein [Bacillus sp. (in: firmicutes)]